MGVPSDMAELAKSGVLSDEGVARASQDLELPPTARDGDVPVAEYVGARLGEEVVDRLVDPLLGGVYAGRSAELSFEATLPALAAASRKHRVPRRGGAIAAAAPPRPGTGRPGPGSRHPRGRISVHHARRRPGDAARLPGEGVGGGGTHRHDGPRAGPRPETAGGSPWGRRRRRSSSMLTR